MVSRKLQQRMSAVASVAWESKMYQARADIWYVRQNCQLSTLVLLLLRQYSPICPLLERECSQYMLLGRNRRYVSYVSAQTVVTNTSECRCACT